MLGWRNRAGGAFDLGDEDVGGLGLGERRDEEGEQQKEILSEGESWQCPRCGAEWDYKPASAQCFRARLGAPFTL